MRSGWSASTGDGVAAKSASANRKVPDYRAEMPKGGKHLRIGVIRRWHETDHKVAAAVQAGIDNAIKVYAAYEQMMHAHPEEFGHRYRDRLILGSFVTSVDYVQATRRRRELMAEITAAISTVDVVLTASNPDEASLIDQVSWWDNIDKPNFTMPFNLTGLPAISVPSGFGPNGLPVAIQLAAKPLQEAVLFRAAHAFEQATPFRAHRPALATLQAVA